MATECVCKVVGVSFGTRQAVLSQLCIGDPVSVVPEPHNQFDPNAIAVVTLQGEHIGYLPRDTAKYFASILQGPRTGTLASLGRSSNSGLLGCTVSFRIQTQSV